MDFASATEGVSFTGMETYKDNIHTEVFDAMKELIRNTEAIQDSVNANWVGNSADNFIANIIKGANLMAEQMDTIKAMLDTELDGIVQQVADTDDSLIELE